MAVLLEGITQRFIGLSSDTKPTTVPVGSRFWEHDTDAIYVTRDGTNWVVRAQPRAIVLPAIGTTVTDGLTLRNPTDAAAGAQQYSPALRFHGEGWKTDAIAASQNVDWRIYAVPVEGATNPTVNLLVQSSVNDAAFVTRLTLGSDGLLTPGGDISLGANRLKTTSLLIKEEDVNTVAIKNTTDNTYKAIKADTFLVTAILALLNNSALQTWDADGNVGLIKSRDSGVGLVEIGRLVGAADPYLQIGRDDTGVALNTVTDMLVLQAGGGTGNEAANFGLGIPVKLGNAASQVEERASLDIVLTTATDGAEAAEWRFNAMNAGAMVPGILRIGSLGLGFFDTVPVARQTGIAVTAAAIHAALVAYGLITA